VLDEVHVVYYPKGLRTVQFLVLLYQEIV